MNRRDFSKHSLALGLGASVLPSYLTGNDFISQRPSIGDRRFTSKAIEKLILKVGNDIKKPELKWLFENCFPNTLDTTVFYEEKNGLPWTYVITGDIEAMWLRDSSAQVHQYLPYMKEDKALERMIEGVIRKQTSCILKDPYANAFYDDDQKQGYWKDDVTDMKPGLHERKWEVDSLCYPVRLGYSYYKNGGNTSVFDQEWLQAMRTIVTTFQEQQRRDGKTKYKFQRNTSWQTDTLAMGGLGNPTRFTGMICSSFRPSDDATIFQFLVPSNLFAVTILNYMVLMVAKFYPSDPLIGEAKRLSREIQDGIEKYAKVRHPLTKEMVLAYEVDGYGNASFMDDANVPNLISMPYLDSLRLDDPVYETTRNLSLSSLNPYYFKGTAGEGIGGPHAGFDMIWHLGIIMRGLTSRSVSETSFCLNSLVATHAGTGFMHEAFHKNDADKFTRKWFAWANSLFGEFVVQIWKNHPNLLVA